MQKAINGLFSTNSEINEGSTPKIIDKSSILLCQQLCELSYKPDLEVLNELGFFDVNLHTDNKLEYEKQNKHAGIIKQVVALVSKTAAKRLNAIFTAKKHKNKYIILISIAGSINFVDWNINMGMQIENGFHRGFYNSSKYILEIAKSVSFPELASELGLENLTLQDIFDECKMPRSKFFILVTGHSKGAALMQCLISLLVNDNFLHTANVLGVGFASPRVVNRQYLPIPRQLPIINILNDEDVITKIASVGHLGYCINYYPDTEMRNACYKISDENSNVFAVNKFLYILPFLKNVGESLAFNCAFLDYLKGR